MPKKSSSSSHFRGRRSKVDPFADIVGVLSDKEVADRAGVSTENVRTWRKRRGIAAGWKVKGTHAAETTAPPSSPTQASGPGTAKSAKKPRRRRSKLDPFRRELGKVPDREIAERSGTSIENVRAYRRRHGIEADWQRHRNPEPGALSSSPEVSAPKTQPKISHRDRWAFRVTVEAEGVEKEYVTFGADVVEAAQVAKDRLARKHTGAFVRKIEVLGVAL